MPIAGSHSDGQLLARNSLISLLGQFVPLLVGLLAIPWIVRSLGTERFGLLTIIWMVVGYFSLFDIGLGRAITKHIAEFVAFGHRSELGTLLRSGLILMLVFGSIGAGLGALITPVLVNKVLNIPEGMRGEAYSSFMILCAVVPLVIIALGLRGTLQALQRFDLVVAVNVPVAINTFIGPLVVSRFTANLVPIVVVLACGRIIGLAVYWILIKRCIKFQIRGEVQRQYIRLLIGTGGWIAVSNIISPLMIYADRFVIGAIMSMAYVAYYATPFEVVTKVLLISSAIATVLFPAFSYYSVAGREKTNALYERALANVFMLIFPILAILSVFGKELLALWLGTGFSENGYIPLQILCLGILANGLAAIPFAYIQGTGRARVTAVVHSMEVPIFLFGIYLLVKNFGIVGAAIAWSGRVIVDAIALHALAWRFQGRGALFIQIMPIQVIVFGACIGLVVSYPSLEYRIIICVLILGMHILTFRKRVADGLRLLGTRRPSASEGNA